MKGMLLPTVLIAFLIILPLSYFLGFVNLSSPNSSSDRESKTFPSTTATDSVEANSIQTHERHAATASEATPLMLDTFKLYPALYICHGAGPLPVLGVSEHSKLADKWREHIKHILSKYGPPKVIAVVSAHYNAAQPCVGGGQMPAMMYDYGGFPRESYSLQYPAPGQPEVARQMVDALKAAGMDAQFDVRRPYDHGVFVPLLAMFPKADIPVVPISVMISDDPSEHIKMGQALRPFRERGVFFLGSGSSMHHFSNFGKRGAGAKFGDALTSTLKESPDMTPETRLEKMRNVATLPGFDEAQPRGAHEHLMPLLTLLGTANGNSGKEVGGDIDFMGASVRHYLFEEI